MDLSSVEILNPWWKTPKAINEDLHIKSIFHKPYYFDNPIKNDLKFHKGHTFILRGARQIGKTTLMKEMIAKSINEKTVRAKNCLFISCETFANFNELKDVLVFWLKDKQNVKSLICLDEITFVLEWQRVVLWIINSGLSANATILVSGSNARDLRKMVRALSGQECKRSESISFIV